MNTSRNNCCSFLRNWVGYTIQYTIFPGSSDPFYIVTYCENWVITSWAHSTASNKPNFFFAGLQYAFMLPTGLPNSLFRFWIDWISNRWHMSIVCHAFFANIHIRNVYCVIGKNETYLKRTFLCHEWCTVDLKYAHIFWSSCGLNFVPTLISFSSCTVIISNVYWFPIPFIFFLNKYSRV